MYYSSNFLFLITSFCLVNSLEGVSSTMKCLFGLPHDLDGAGMSPDGMIKDVLELINLLDHRSTEDSLLSNKKISLLQVSTNTLFLLQFSVWHLTHEGMLFILFAICRLKNH